MQIVLLSGGSGKRLWPLSNEIRSKQFIPIFKQVDGSYLSMAQRVYRQIRTALPEARVTVATSKSQVAALRHQLGDDVRISVEPCRRDTFPAIVLVSAYLKDVCRVSEEEPIAVCPVDPYVEAHYFRQVGELARMAKDGMGNLALMGIEPTYPSAKYGYIVPRTGDRVAQVDSFVEKPDEKRAEELIQKGALWNSGVFAYRLGYVLETAHRLLRFSGYDDLYANYAELSKISFDYAVAEKESDISVLRYRGTWKDLGTWNTFTEIMETPSIGDVTMDEDCRSVHVVNELDVPLLCMGLQDIVVAASPDGILVSDKSHSSYIKPYVDGMDSQLRIAEKSWGEFRVIDVGNESMTIRVTLHPGHAMNYHSHTRRSEVWTVIEGHGTATVDGVERRIQAGDTVEIPVGARHTVSAGECTLKLIEVQVGKDISVEDKVKWRR
ncbi:sugar phosphate nucleotidyltransferase [Selenomonas sp. TAMA-11512]|uniref:sugar phosphate nucleotidyltransferase n=1 Tax=Selenomonas sp. TAMA-11512 TaxID=3095337 RepID=UPI00308AFCBC|nr:sugar phosphate nucleotidyltransferase [Selenomonas sp. TAMA-11512]